MKRLNDQEWVVSHREVLGFRLVAVLGFLAFTWSIIHRAGP